MRYRLELAGDTVDQLRESLADWQALLERGLAPAPHVPGQMPLADPAGGPLCAEHRTAMIHKPADAARGRPEAYWCSTYGCRQRLEVQAR